MIKIFIYEKGVSRKRFLLNSGFLRFEKIMSSTFRHKTQRQTRLHHIPPSHSESHLAQAHCPYHK